MMRGRKGGVGLPGAVLALLALAGCSGSKSGLVDPHTIRAEPGWEVTYLGWISEGLIDTTDSHADSGGYQLAYERADELGIRFVARNPRSLDTSGRLCFLVRASSSGGQYRMVYTGGDEPLVLETSRHRRGQSEDEVAVFVPHGLVVEGEVFRGVLVHEGVEIAEVEIEGREFARLPSVDAAVKTSAHLGELDVRVENAQIVSDELGQTLTFDLVQEAEVPGDRMWDVEARVLWTNRSGLVRSQEKRAGRYRFLRDDAEYTWLGLSGGPSVSKRLRIPLWGQRHTDTVGMQIRAVERQAEETGRFEIELVVKSEGGKRLIEIPLTTLRALPVSPPGDSQETEYRDVTIEAQQSELILDEFGGWESGKVELPMIRLGSLAGEGRLTLDILQDDNADMEFVFNEWSRPNVRVRPRLLDGVYRLSFGVYRVRPVKVHQDELVISLKK